MAAQRLTLHLDPVRSAANLLLVLDVLGREPDTAYPSYGAILERIRRDYDFTDRSEPLSLAHLLGLLSAQADAIVLSPKARTIATLRPAIQADVLHFLLATAWQDNGDPSLGCAWAYRAFCDRLWSHGVIRIDATEGKSIVADLLDEAQRAFPTLRLAALSPKSVLGMRKWLEPLSPPVLSDDQFRRREICSSELLLLAIGHVARENGAQISVDLPMTPARREAICRLCLLEPAALDRALDRTIPAFPTIIAPGTRTGAFGRFIRLKTMPTVESLGASR
ncbi:MAG: hypothetical protein U0V87_18600 [Acidobacteriota bacterium]